MNNFDEMPLRVDKWWLVQHLSPAFRAAWVYRWKSVQRDEALLWKPQDENFSGL